MKHISAILLIFKSLLSWGQEMELGRYTRQNKGGDYPTTTTLKIGPEQTFQYECKGHMFYDKAAGSYVISPNKVITLNYDSTQLNDPNYRSVVAGAPKKFQYKNGRLYEVSDKGRLIKTRRLLSNHRRFYVFGEFSRRRKVFLERTDDLRASQ